MCFPCTFANMSSICEALRSTFSKNNKLNKEVDNSSLHSIRTVGENSSLVSEKSEIPRCCYQGSLAVRRWQLFQMIVLPFIPILALVVQNSSLLSTVEVNLQETWEMKQQIGTIDKIGKLLTELQQERAELGFCLFTNAPASLSNSSLHNHQPQSAKPAYNRNISSNFRNYEKSTSTNVTENGVTSTLPSWNSLPQSPTSSPNNISYFKLSPEKTGSSLSPPPTPATKTSQAVQHEKGMSTQMRNSLCRRSLSLRFDRTEEFIANLSTHLSKYVPSVVSLRSKRERIFRLTAQNDSADDTALDELLWYNVANDVILDLLSELIGKIETSGVWKLLIAYKNIIRCIENYSISMVYGLYYFGKGKLTQNSYNKYIQFDALAVDYLNAAKSFSPEVLVLWDKMTTNQSYKQEYLSLGIRHGEIYRNDRNEVQASSQNANVYFANMTTYINELKKLQLQLGVRIDEQVTDEMISAKLKRIVAATLLSIVMVISPIVIYLVKTVTVTIQSYSVVLSTKTADLKREKRKSDHLLHQMLPAEAIRQLRARKQVPAENFESVTIYFSDIVNFTAITASSSPMQIVVMLNSLYNVFDSRIGKYDVYKVETIGDSYMVVSGLPIRNGNLHAAEICTMALDLVAGVQRFEIPHRPRTSLQIRVGINTGCCVAGVVGTKMPRYCLFGDSINVASRMESHGEPMKIHITETTKRVLDEFGGFITEDRGVLDIKGKGEMNTYWLVDKIGGLPRPLEMASSETIRVDSSTFTAHTPEFLREIFGSSIAEDDSDTLLEIASPNFTRPSCQIIAVSPAEQHHKTWGKVRRPKF